MHNRYNFQRPLHTEQMVDQKITDYFHPSLGASFVLWMRITRPSWPSSRYAGEWRSSGGRTRNCRHRRLCKSQSALKGDPHRSVSKFRSLQEKYEEVIKEWRGPPKSMPRREPKTFPVHNEETEVIFLRFYMGRSIPEIAYKL